ncbi:ABC transporter permease [Anaerobium acetethylicum]|uniref:Transport permease protein n=1 Tax=Anaerobium acetethylicum TaxID=1619234 RepID=A0A1D3TQC0_9FIRM|nr:ABC transporter permease [Anaerobium acetethylicum]SCP95727.1 teichoic acid transport system permease protein [Anaerobium acetethylicum]
MNIIKDIFKNRKLVLYLSKNDFKTKYAGSYLGIIWAFVQPLITILLYWFVFQVGLRSQNVGEIPFVLWLMAGLIPWFYFSESVINGTNCFLEYSYLVKKVVFDIKVLPIVKVISSLYVHAFFIALLVVVYTVSGRFPGLIAIQLLYYTLCMIMLSLSLVYFTSAVAIFFKDATQLINIFMQIGVWMTPIMWNIAIIKGNLLYVFKANPMYYVVEGYRDTMINGIWFFEKPSLTVYFWVFVLVMLIFSKYVFTRLKPHFSDSL